MREILFRGKRIDSELWVEGSLVNNIFFRAGTNCPVPYIINPDEYEEYCCMEDIGELAVEVIGDTVGQFTGLKDKNGKKIFEGDIVEFSYCNNVYKAEVVYNNKTCGFEVRYFTVVGVYGERALHSINFANIESIKVIGNIHDNPELLS